MKNIKTNESAKKIQVSINFALKDAFKILFTNAKWNSLDKLWEIPNTDANKSKLKLFEEQAKQAAELAANADNLEATTQQVEELQAALQKFEHTKSLLVEHLSSASKLAQKLEGLKEQLLTANSEAASLKTLVEATEKANTERLEAILSNYTHEGRSVQAVLNRCGKLLRSGYQGKSEFNSLTQWLYGINDSIQSTHKIKFEVLDSCANANFNRPDRDAKLFDADIFSARLIETL